MPVYSYKTLSDLRHSLTSLADTLYAKTALSLTPDEALAAYVHPDHIPMLQQVQEICSPSTNIWYHSTMQCSTGEVLNFTLSFNGGSPVIMPKYIEHGVQPSCPEELRARITAWADQRYAFGCAIGDAYDAISSLNETCGDVRAMALMLPCLTTIMGNMSTDAESSVVKRARKLSQASGFGSLPRLPVQVKQRLSEISAIVNAVTLMADAPNVSPPMQHARFDSAKLRDSTRRNIFWVDYSDSVYPVATFY